MALKINTKYPSIDDLRAKAQKKIPKFAFEYLDGGCNEDVNLHRNTSELREVQLKPNYLRDHAGSSQKTTLFGIEYDAPFGIAPVGCTRAMRFLALARCASLASGPACELKVSLFGSCVLGSALE